MNTYRFGFQLGVSAGRVQQQHTVRACLLRHRDISTKKTLHIGKSFHFQPCHTHLLERQNLKLKRQRHEKIARLLFDLN